MHDGFSPCFLPASSRKADARGIGSALRRLARIGVVGLQAAWPKERFTL
jgi:hypothetical protein